MHIRRGHPWRILALCWSWAAVSAAAADSRPVTLPIVDGYDVWFARPAWESMSHTRVTEVVQDDLGFIWLGTLDGLRRYDGIRFKHYRPEPWHPNSLRGANIEALFKGSDGHLWISSDHFLDRFDPVAEVFTHYPSQPGGIEGQVYHISQDRAGAMWLATDHGLVKLDPIAGTTIRYQHRPDDSSTLSSDIVRASRETRDGSFWVATTRGVDVFDRRAGRVIRRIPVHVGVENALMTLFEDHREALWVTYSSGNGLASIDRTTYAVTYYSTNEREPDPSQLTGVEAILEDQDGTLWIATQGRGILRLDKDRKQFVRYRNRPDDTRSVSDDFVYCLFADHEGAIWAGTSGAGVNRFTAKPPPFRTYRHNRTNPQSLARSLVESVMEDSTGILWVGTKGVLNRIVRGSDGRPDQYTFYDASDRSHGIVSTNVMSMAEDRSGHLWFGTFGGGINRLDPKTGRFKVYRHDPSDPRSLADDVVTSLYVDRNGALWAGSDTGISRFDPQSDRFDVYRIGSPPVSQYHVIAEDPHGTFWLASWQGGLQRFDPATGEFAVYPYDPSGRGISSDWVNTVLVDRAGIIWAGTQAGLNRLDPRTGEFALFRESEGLSNSGVTGILEDRDGNLWLATNNGLNKFDPRSGSVRHFFTSDGIAANEFSRYGTAFQSSTGEMFFGSYGGLTAFFPEQVRERAAPRLVLTDFQVNGKPVPIGPDSPLSQSISYAPSITLDYTHNVLSIGFAALAFAGQDGIRFRYRLRDVDTEWVHTDSTRLFASYTNLSPGRHLFEVQATNVPQVWPRPANELEMVVLPPWWSTWWFRALYALVFVALLWTAYQVRLRQLHRQFALTFEARIDERLRIARELHDTLLQSFQGLLLLFHTVSRLLPDRPSEAKKRLESAVEQAAEAITEGRDAVQGLRASTPQSNELALAINTLGQDVAAKTAHRRPVDFRVHLEGETRDLHPVARDEIYKITAEALRNAFQHAEARRVEVEIRYDDREFRLRVRDDGKGIDPAVLSGSGRDGHYGLPGMQERSKVVGGKLTVWSEADAGTEIELRIPATNSYVAPRKRSWFSRRVLRTGNPEGGNR
jgi:signal transduction histidine kinase/ligand-binding sensor domain-containing protein